MVGKQTRVQNNKYEDRVAFRISSVFPEWDFAETALLGYTEGAG